MIGLVIGQNANGKTWFTNKLKRSIARKEIKIRWMNEAVIFIQLIRKEHKENPTILRHDHPWCEGTSFHSHIKKENIVIFDHKKENISHNVRKSFIPFTICSNDIAFEMRKKMCQLLDESDNKFLTVAEMAFGKNINDGNAGGISTVDLTSNIFASQIENNLLPNEWIKNIKWIVVILTTSQRRFELNFIYKNKSGDELSALESPFKNKKVLDMLGEEDFQGSRLERIFKNKQIPIFYLRNKTDKQMSREIQNVIKKIKRIHGILS